MAQDQKAGGAVMDRLKTEARGLVGALGDRALSSVQDKVQGATGRLNEYVEGGGGPGLMTAVTGAKNVAEGKGPARSMAGAGFKGLTEKVKGLFGKGGKGGQGKKLKVTNIVESIDVGVPIDVAYDQWTQFTDFPSFMKKVENVDQVEDEKLHWKAQVFWSHREWDADIIEQIPNKRIVWQSKGAKGHVDGAVTFHKLSPEMTRIIVILEYHPQGLFEHTGNLWRAVGRRARLELKHFERHVMTNAILHPDEIEGWHGVIHDGEVVEDDEQARASEEEGDEPEDREPEDGEPEDELADEDYDDEQDEDDEPADEYAEDDEEDEEVSSNGRRSRGRPGRMTEGTPSGRSRRPAGRKPRSGRSDGAEERPQRTTRRRSGSREGSSQ
jgi:uncharacterized membrane protein